MSYLVGVEQKKRDICLKNYIPMYTMDGWNVDNFDKQA